MTDVQHIIEDLTQVNTIVRHTAAELREKAIALVGQVEGQVKQDVQAILDMVDTIHAAALSTASAAVVPDTAHTPQTALPGVDIAALVTQEHPSQDAPEVGESPVATAEVTTDQPEQTDTKTRRR